MSTIPLVNGTCYNLNVVHSENVIFTYKKCPRFQKLSKTILIV